MSVSTIEIVIPAYNEAHRILPTLKQYTAFFAQWNEAHEQKVQLHVVANGCSDETYSVSQQVAAQYPNLLVVSNILESVGKGGAIYAAWNISNADVVGFVDADGATSAEEFSKLLTYFLSNPSLDGVIGSRFIAGATVVNRTSRIRSIMSYCFVTLVRWLFWLPYHDTQCGAKLLKRNAYMAVQPKLREQHLQFDVELLWKLKHAGKTIAEIPTIWVDQPASATLEKKSAFFAVGFRMVWQLLRLRLAR